MREHQIIIELNVHTKHGTSFEVLYGNPVMIDSTDLYIELGTVTVETFGHYIIQVCNIYGCLDFSVYLKPTNQSNGNYNK